MKENFIIVDENDNAMFGGQRYTEEGANNVWNMCDGTWEDENGERRIYIKEVEEPKKPESLNTVTIGQTRQQYRNNEKSLKNVVLLVLTGCFEEAKAIAGEDVLNRVMTEMLIQQEYIREREKANWGWDRNSVDFSKDEGNILQEGKR